MSERNNVLTLEEFEEFLGGCSNESPAEYPLREETINKFFEYVKGGIHYANKEFTSRRNKS